MKFSSNLDDPPVKPVRSRASRRFKKRNVKKRSLKRYAAKDYDLSVARERHIAVVAAETSQICSDFCCGNPRKHFKEKTRQEVKAAQGSDREIRSATLGPDAESLARTQGQLCDLDRRRMFQAARSLSKSLKRFKLTGVSDFG